MSINLMGNIRYITMNVMNKMAKMNNCVKAREHATTEMKGQREDGEEKCKLITGSQKH